MNKGIAGPQPGRTIAQELEVGSIAAGINAHSSSAATASGARARRASVASRHRHVAGTHTRVGILVSIGGIGSMGGSDGPPGRRKRRSLLAAGATLTALLLLPAGSAIAAKQHPPGPKVAPGVFLAKAPKGPQSEERLAPPSYEPRIVGGNTTTIAEWPWQVAITADPEFFSGDGFDRQFCAGSLVAPTIVISAAHCFFDVLDPGNDFDNPDLFAAISGRTQLSSSTGQEIEIANLYFFVDGRGKPLFNKNTLEWDAVFVQLASPSPSSNSTPIKIAGADEATFWAPGDENAWATGWGTISSGGAASDILREVNVDRIADSTCGSASSYGSDFDPETMLCAGELAGGQDTCQGDSGGPLMTPIGGGAFRLIGDTSWGFGCALPDLPGVYGRVAEDPMCSALRQGIQDVAAADVVGTGGCLGGSPAPPDPPTITDTDPDSPAKDNNPEVKGTVGAGSPTQVKIHTNASCSGDPDATGTVAEFTGAGITVNVPDNTTTTLSARATDATANDSSCSNSFDYIEDSTAPDTTIDTGPSDPTNDSTPEFTFSSDEGSSTFECRVDGGSFSACTSPHATASLADVSHTFEVRATDSANNTDPTPASSTFTVDSTISDTDPPQTTIDSAPADPTNDDTPEFTFSADEGGSTFECRLDSSDPGDWQSCSSPKSYGPLADGSHTFEVRATDQASNTDPTPASHTWEIDTSAPPPQDGSGAADDDTEVSGKVGAKKSQKQRGNRIRIVIKVKAGEPLTASAKGSIRVNPKFKLRRLNKKLDEGVKKTLRLKPKRRSDERKIVKALKRGDRARAKLTVKLTDELGNSSLKKLRVKLKR